MAVILVTGQTDLGWALRRYTHEKMNLFFVLLVYCSSIGVGGHIATIVDNRMLQYADLISYGIYLYHQDILSAYDGLVQRGAGHAD